MTDSISAVAHLQSQWRGLCDLDRARAVQSIHQSGMTLRELAPQLNSSASLLSHLLRALQAPAKDRELARRGEISTAELVHRARASGTGFSSNQREAIAFERENSAVQASDTIMKWFDEQNVASIDRVQVIDQTFIHLARGDRLDLGSLGDALPDIPLDEVICLFRPALLDTDEDHTVAWYARWLALWTLHGISDDQIRVRALELAAAKETLSGL